MIPRLRDMLGAFLFRGDDVYKQINVLSGGEKSRLALVRLLLKPINLLILDEPTNHLDLHSKDVLLEALRSFGGTVIFVSHDRGFIEGLSTRVLELTRSEDGSPSQVRSFPGDYRYYVERLEREALLVQGDTPSAAPVAAAPADNAIASPLSRDEAKKRKAERRRLEREEERLLADIAEAEETKGQKEILLATPQVYSDAIKSRQIGADIERLEKHIAELTGLWETVLSQMEGQL